MDELEHFKRADLRQYAASVGYALDRRESSAGSSVMRRDHDKVIVSRKPDGHYIYWSPRDENDRGTIIDFVQKRHGVNLGEVRKIVRAWLGEPQPPLPALPKLATTKKQVDMVQARYAAMRVAMRHAYLEDERGIPPEILQHRRFAGRIKIDRYRAAVFPHVDDANAICGYELKNTNGFSGFASGGRKGLFISNTFESDRRLVLAESGVDVLSYAAIFGDFKTARYGSIGGKPTPSQRGVVRGAITALPGGSEVVAATDADEAGDELADGIKSIFDSCNRADLSYRRERPIGRKDWNDILRASSAGPGKKHLSTVHPV